MKTLLACVLSVCLYGSQLQTQAETNAPPVTPAAAKPGEPPPNVTLIEVLVVIGCAVAAGYTVIKLWKIFPAQDRAVTLVLDKSTDGRGTWTPIYTNTVVLAGSQPIEFFRDRMTDDLAFYRVRVLRQ